MLRVDAREARVRRREEGMDGGEGGGREESKWLGILFLFPYLSLQSASPNVPTRHRVPWMWAG